jgi:hypothetical protein
VDDVLVDRGQPRAMFSATDAENRNASCGTQAIAPRSAPSV